MNHTNRALNRALLLIFGLVLLGAGLVGVGLAVWPTAATAWGDVGGGADAWLAQVLEATRIAGTAATWIGIGAIAIILVALVLLVLALTRLIRRRSRTVVLSNDAQTPLGRVTITEGFVSDAVRNALADRDEILTVQVTANEIRSTPVLHVSVTPRQNTDPRELVDRIDLLLRNLTALTGQEIDTYISIHSGLRVRLAHDQARLT